LKYKLLTQSIDQCPICKKFGVHFAEVESLVDEEFLISTYCDNCPASWNIVGVAVGLNLTYDSETGTYD